MDNSRSMVEMHSDICEDIAGNSTNISPKPEAPGSSPGRRTKSAVISMATGFFFCLLGIVFPLVFPYESEKDSFFTTRHAFNEVIHALRTCLLHLLCNMTVNVESKGSSCMTEI